MSTKRQTALLEPGARWMTTEGRPTPEFYQWLREVDRLTRIITGNVDDLMDAPPVPEGRFLVAACSDEITPIEAGTAKITLRMPFGMILTEVRATLTTAQTGGARFTVDINEGGSTILSTKLSFDNSESTTVTSSVPAVISDSELADDAIITVDVDQVGNGTACGLKIMLIGTEILP